MEKYQIENVKVGPQGLADGSLTTARGGKSGETIIGQAHGKYAEASMRGKIFVAANQTGCVWTIGLATTYTGCVVSNPAGSGVNLSILGASFSEVVAPGGIQMAYLAGAYSATAVTHSVPGVILPCLIGSGATSQAKFDTGATLPVAPAILLPMTSGKTSAALSTAACPAWTEVGGLITVAPGGFIAVCCFTVGAAVGQYGAIMWEEVPII